MGRFALLAGLFATLCFAQTATPDRTKRDASGGMVRPPESLFASLPSAASNNGYRYTVTDCATTACTSGSGDGSIVRDLRSNGSSWVCQNCATGTGSPDTPIFTGTQVQRYVQCAMGTVPYTSLTTAGASQEITILTAVSGNARYTSLTVNPSTAFTGGSATLPTVSMGRPGGTDTEMSGVATAIGGSSSAWSVIPSPPQLTSTYAIVLNFAVATGNVNAFTAGSVDWELCGHAAH